MKKLFRKRLMCTTLSVFFTLIVTLLINYWLHPAINVHSSGTWFLVLFMILHTFAVHLILTKRTYRKLAKDKDFCEEYRQKLLLRAKVQHVDAENGKIQEEYRNLLWKEECTWHRLNFTEKIQRCLRRYAFPTFLALLAFLTFVLWFSFFIESSVMCNAQDYANLLEVVDGDFERDIITANSEDIISVDVKTAQRLGDRVLGSIENSSWYEVNDEYNLVTINGKLYRISPLDFRSIFTYWKANTIPGYVRVDAQTMEAQYVEFTEPMKYSPSACFDNNLGRYLRNKFPDLIFGKSFFEVDDDGNPYWITPIRTPAIGVFGGYLEKTVIITDAVSGSSEIYPVAPDWVDHVHSVSYLMNLVEWHYKYSNGFLNWSNTNKYHTSYSYRDSKKESSEDNAANEFTPFDGYNSVLSPDGEILFYTGITPANQAETLIGFVLISPKTGVAKFYPMSGSEESSAQLAAEGLVSDFKYSASFPTVVNVDGNATFFMTLKDKAGIVQNYAFCNMKQYSVCVQASTIDEALHKYKVALGLEEDISQSDDTQSTTVVDVPSKPEVPDTTEYLAIDGTVTEVKEAQMDGYTWYYFRIDSSDLMMMSSIENSFMQPLSLVVGANVSLTYSVTEGIGMVKGITFK